MSEQHRRQGHGRRADDRHGQVAATRKGHMVSEDEIVVRRKDVARAFVILTVVFVVVLSALGYLVRENTRRSAENRDRVAEVAALARIVDRESRRRDAAIQRSRILSCEQNYRAFRKVFQPLTPPKNVRTAKMQSDIDKFHARISELIEGCKVQTRTPQAP